MMTLASSSSLEQARSGSAVKDLLEGGGPACVISGRERIEWTIWTVKLDPSACQRPLDARDRQGSLNMTDSCAEQSNEARIQPEDQAVQHLHTSRPQVVLTVQSAQLPASAVNFHGSAQFMT